MTASTVDVAAPPLKGRSLWQDAVRRLRRNRAAMSHRHRWRGSAGR